MKFEIEWKILFKYKYLEEICVKHHLMFSGNSNHKCLRFLPEWNHKINNVWSVACDSHLAYTEISLLEKNVAVKTKIQTADSLITWSVALFITHYFQVIPWNLELSGLTRIKANFWSLPLLLAVLSSQTILHFSLGLQTHHPKIP